MWQMFILASHIQCFHLYSEIWLYLKRCWMNLFFGFDLSASCFLVCVLLPDRQQRRSGSRTPRSLCLPTSRGRHPPSRGRQALMFRTRWTGDAEVGSPASRCRWWVRVSISEETARFSSSHVPPVPCFCESVKTGRRHHNHMFVKCFTSCTCRGEVRPRL